MDGKGIIFPDIAICPRFALDEVGYHATNTAYFVPRTSKDLLGILNSRFAFFYFRQVCAGLEGGEEIHLRFFGQYLEGFPVAHTGTSDGALAALVDFMLSLHQRLASERLPQRRG